MPMQFLRVSQVFEIWPSICNIGRRRSKYLPHRAKKPYIAHAMKSIFLNKRYFKLLR